MDWKLGPPVLVGEKIWWSGDAQNRPQQGVVRWIGRIPELCPDWCAGIELEGSVEGGCDGIWMNRKLFECKPQHGVLIPMKEIEKLNARGNSRTTSIESRSDLKLDASQVRDSTKSDLRNKSIKKKQEARVKDRYSSLEWKLSEWSLRNRTSDKRNSRIKNRTTIAEEVFDRLNVREDLLKSKNQDVRSSLRKRRKRKSSQDKSKRHTQTDYGLHDVTGTLDDLTNFTVNEAYEKLSTLESNARLGNMNDVAGYFKEIKEGDERFFKPDEGMSDLNGQGRESKQKKFFSFLKWFKKNKDEPSLRLPGESSVASSPMFDRKRNSSCESVDTLFSTQTVRSFAYIPPTQYEPSAPPIDLDKSSEDLQKIPSEECIYDRKKKRKAPPPPRLSRENSLPTTLEHKKEDDYDKDKTFHRRTVSESFKDKKAGAYCHVQGKRKAPLPPPTSTSIYPNLQKMNNPYPSLYKKKKPAPPPPETGTPEPVKKIQEGKPANDPEEKEPKTNERKEGLIKDMSLSPLPSRPWYKRSHRDSTGSNIIRKDFLKGFDKKKNKETDDWMPEVGFPRRSLSTESNHNKFNIFSRLPTYLDKNEDKKKEEKRKSQISILTNISELDREAAEIVRKEQEEERKMLEENNARYYSNVRPEEDKTVEVKEDGGEGNGKIRDEEMKDKENQLNPGNQSGEKPKQNLFSPSVLADVTNSSTPAAAGKAPEASPTPGGKTEKANPTPARLNHFKVENKELNYLNEPWVCQKCTLENPGWRVFCEICSSVKPKFLFNPTKVQKQEPSKAETPEEKKKEEKEVAVKAEKVEEKKKEAKEVAVKAEKVEEKKEEEAPIPPPPVESLEELRKRRMTFFTPKTEGQAAEETTAPPQNREKTSVPVPGNKEKEAGQALGNTGKEFVSPPGVKEMSESPAGNKGKESDLRPVIKEMSEPPNRNNGRESGPPPANKGKASGSPGIREMPEPPPGNKRKGSVPLPEMKEIPGVSPGIKEMSEPPKIKGRQPEPSPANKYPGPLPGNKEKESPPKNKQEENKAKLEVTEIGKEKLEETQYGAVKKKQPKKEEIAEAYIVTKTIVLEDIIVKKGEKTPKVSASVQTKAVRQSSQEAVGDVRPPPRTKKALAELPAKGSQDLEKPSTSKQAFTEDDLEELMNKLTHAEGVADFRANIETMAPNTEMNTVAVNRLLRKLETAIGCGDHFVAAGLAKELALMKINCSVRRQVASPSKEGTSSVTIDLYVEDKISHQGPIPMQVSPTMTLLQLKKKIQEDLGIPPNVQRWILGKKLATDDNKTLEAEGVKSDFCSVFLYLVAPDNRTEKEVKLEEKSEVKDPAPVKEDSPEEKKKGWYYNYEEDHYSYCEDSDESREASPAKMTPNVEKKTQEEAAPPTERRPSLFDLKTREAENEVEKELKLISVNSVKQKVERLNRTFAENSRPMRPGFKPSPSPETWKCGACAFVNPPGRLTCSGCSAKKVVARLNSPKIGAEDVRKKDKPGVSNIHYKELMQLQDADLVPNAEPFNCSICMVDYSPGEGVTLKDCLHTFCRTCLVSTVQFSEDAEVKCPYLDDTYSCTSVMQQREIKALVPKGIFELHLAKSVKEAENKIGNAFHCKTPDCKGWCIYEDNVNEFHCPVCKFSNCLTCQAIHTGINCRQYQERMKDASETDVDAKKTRDMLEEMVEKGEAMACPKCQVVLMKKWGCDWLRCSMCKTEICWVTRGFRWGPGGKGDTSGGCKCGVNGVKCHPKCNYCH